VWNFEDAKTVRCLFASEDYSADGEEHSTATHHHHLRCIAALRVLPEDLVAYGDSGCNVKVLDWKCGLLHKLPNHVGEMGFTDGLVVTRGLLLASSFDVDTGRGHTNVFKVVPGQTVPSYLCSWSDEETGRIHGLGASFGATELTFVTCGREVKLWRTVKCKRDLPKEEDAILVRPSLLPLFSDEAVDSGSESDLTDTEDESESSDSSSRQRRRRNRANSAEKVNEKGGWWCALM
jgi:hypothetical protein